MQEPEPTDGPIARTVITVPFRYGGEAGGAAAYANKLRKRSWLTRDGGPGKLWEDTALPKATRDLAPAFARVFSSHKGSGSPWTVHNLRVKDARQFFERRLVIEGPDGDIPIAAAFHRMEIAIYPVEVAILYIELRWDELPAGLLGETHDIDAFTDRLADRVRVLRQLRQATGGSFAENWSFPAPARPGIGRPTNGNAEREHAAIALMPERLQGASRGNNRISLAELAHWFVAATDDEARQGLSERYSATPLDGGSVRFDDVPTYTWAYTTLTWPRDPGIGNEHMGQLLFRLARGAPSVQLPPPDLSANVRFLRQNRAIGSWREGFAAVNWYKPGLHEPMERIQWPGDLVDHYLHVALFLCAERDALHELTRHVGDLLHGYEDDTGAFNHRCLPELLGELHRHVRFTAGFVGEDSGGNSDMAEFFQLIRSSLRTPQVLAEYRAEVEELIRYADTLYEQQLHTMTNEAAEKDQRFQRRVSSWGLGAAVAAAITGIFGMNLEVVARLVSVSQPAALGLLTVLAFLGAGGGYAAGRTLATSSPAKQLASDPSRSLGHEPTTGKGPS